MHGMAAVGSSGGGVVKPTFSVTDPDSDLLRITPLGAGQEVGRSCHIVEYKSKKIMLDCGIHPGYYGVLSLPFLDQIDPAEIDIIFITHFHLDHCGALPWLLTHTHFKGRVFMTHATKAIYKWLVSDYIRVTSSSAEALFTEKDLDSTMERIEIIHFHQQKEVSGVRFTCYHAGHVLGAAMFLFDIAGVKILYTGDFSRHEDRHLMAAEIPPIKPDILIMESTYGIYIHEKREIREQRFTSCVRDIVLRGGRCLIPAFALGRAQEQLLILDEFWELHQDELGHIPVYYASSLAKKCMSVYQTYSSAMNEKMRAQISICTPFKFKHIDFVKGMSEFSDSGPCAILASPGMLQNGFSRDLFERWCSDAKNGVIIAGYSVEGTLAKELMSEPEQVLSVTGRPLQRKCSIDYISFSAHADYNQFKELVEGVMPKHIVLVHGEANEMTRLKTSLMRDLHDNSAEKFRIYTPKNCHTLEFHFKGELTAKIVGSLVPESDKDNDGLLSGIIIKNCFSYKILSIDDISRHTELKTTKVIQKLSIPFPESEKIPLLLRNLALVSGHHIEITPSPQEQDTPTVMVIMNCIAMSYVNRMLVMEWESDVTNDMIADSIIAVVLETCKQDTFAAELNYVEILGDKSHAGLVSMLKNSYGESKVVCIETCSSNDGASNEETDGIDEDASSIDHEPKKKKHMHIHVLLDEDEKAIINMSSHTVSCNIPAVKEHIGRMLCHYLSAIKPFCCAHKHF